MLESLNSRQTHSLEVVLKGDGALILDNGNLGESASLEGIKITRDSGKKGPLVIIEGVKTLVKLVQFDNGLENIAEYAIEGRGNYELSLIENEISNTYLEAKNKLDIKIVDSSYMIGEDFALVKGSIKFGTTVKNKNGVVSFIVKDKNGNIIGKTQHLEINNNTSETFTFEKTITNLFYNGVAIKPNTEYKIEMFLEVSENGNKFRSNIIEIPFKTFKVEILDKTIDSATLKITHGTIDESQYPLIFTATSENNDVVKIDTIIKNRTDYPITGLAKDLNYNYVLTDKNGNKISSGVFIVSEFSDSISSIEMDSSLIYDTTATIFLSNSDINNKLKNAKDFITNIYGITVNYGGSKLQLNGLVPKKEYKDLVIIYTDGNGVQRKLILPPFTTTDTNKLGNFILDVYKHALQRVSEENGYAYWLDTLKNKRMTPEKFVLNLLSEKEFLELYKTTEEKIEALYRVIVNREADAEGFAFWVREYDKLINRKVEELEALLQISTRMVNEPEFKQRVSDLEIDK